ncbi:MAG: AMP-binding protein, partial [Ilumatobacteraceae bacterium]
TAGVLLPLMNGMRTVIGLSPLRHKENLQLIRRWKPTVMLSTDTFLNQLYKAANPEDLASLRFVVAGAERLKPRTRELYEALGVTMLEAEHLEDVHPAVHAGHDREVPARCQRETLVGIGLDEPGVVPEEFVGVRGERVDRRHPTSIAVGVPRARTVASEP